MAEGTRPKPVARARLPVQVETRDTGLIYVAETDSWYSAMQSVFRPAASSAIIDIASAGGHNIIPGVSGKVIRIVSLTFTVTAAVSIWLLMSAQAISGAMNFGGDGEPRGIVIPFPYTPLSAFIDGGFGMAVEPVDPANPFYVGGLVCYFYH